ncbi:SGNH/GDSL hydrolase family protein [Bacillaceae bacterium IKA-2]|nr:SGNH/GDSL hydrolase family protein [Bacillaceae bacterium IKA-2]
MTKRLLFIGDSITESGRYEDERGIGNGYVNVIYNKLIAEDPSLQIFNRGVGGDKITDLEERWDEDVLSLNPDILSVSIGVNDVWHQLDHPDSSLVDPIQFELIYRRLLQSIDPKVKVILMEPTIITESISSEGNKQLKVYAAIVRKIAKELSANLVPTFTVFMDRLEKGNHLKLTTDGVHMTKEGNELMAETWLTAVSTENFSS